MIAAEPILCARGLSKRFGPIEACRSVDIDIRRGELTAIVGDNGAGKSTLAKMLCGALRPDEGHILLEGREVAFSDPLSARASGIEPVYQNLALAPNLDAVANLFLGRELTRAFLGLPLLRRLDHSSMRALAEGEVERLRVDVPRLQGLPMGRMSGGQQQSVAIARAAHWARKVLIMDEPTAALGVRESEAVLRLVKSIVAEGIAVVMISHVLPHVIELADRVVVMRHGKRVGDLSGDEVSMDTLVRLIIGADVEEIRTAVEAPEPSEPPPTASGDGGPVSAT
jgi:fructose transport system ATP-binding protein